MNKQLYILNEESLNTTFRNRRGVSNIDLTIITNQLLRTVAQWKISDEESSSDHNIIKYVIGQGDSKRETVDFQDARYLFKNEKYATFQENLRQLAKTTLCGLHNAETTEDLDNMFCARVAEKADIEKSIEEFHFILMTACNKAYRKHRTSKKTKHNSVPW
jgi:exonuclease III